MPVSGYYTPSETYTKDEVDTLFGAGVPSPLDSWPIGSIFITVSATAPATLLGGGTWVAFATGRVLVGIDGGDSDFDTVEETGGAKTHSITPAELPAHTHPVPTVATGGTRAGTFGDDYDAVAIDNTGAPVETLQNSTTNDPMPVVQPYIIVKMWKRTA